ncbi:hypothetical protein ACVKXF_003643, partial [Curtobacterium sp. PvP017]
MAPSSFRTAAVVCGIVTASLGVGLLTPVTATAASTPTAAAASPSPTDSTTSSEESKTPDFDNIPVDPSFPEPRFVTDWSTPWGSRTVVGWSGGDETWLVIGNEVFDRATGPGFFLNVQDRHQDAGLEVIRVDTAEDGTQTRGERIPMPRGITVDDVDPENTFEPGVMQFTGSATAGATIVATDTVSGDELFTTEVSTTRSGTGTWSADAELSDREHKITLTQTTPEGRTNQLRDIHFTPADADAPTAPTLQTNERRLDGAFVLAGQYDKATDSVVVEDEAGEEITTATLTETGYVAQIPQNRLGETVFVVARSAEGTRSTRTAAQLQQFPTDASVAAPALQDVKVYPDGRVQVVGQRDDAAGLWILDGDRVVSGVLNKEGWSYTIPAAETDKQLDIVNLGFDNVRYVSVSERVALPRLLQVEDLATENTYQPGTRAFTGTAEAGAT